MRGAQSRFDWYQATFDGLEEDQIPRALMTIFGGTISRSKGKFGYALCQAIEVDGKVLARVFTGSSRPGEVHVSVTGESCDKVVPVLRRMWPDHRVSRVDSSVDFSASFEELDAVAVKFAEDRGLSYRLVTDSEGGATRYLGAPSSEVRVRVYKKTEELRHKHPDQAAEIPDGIVRAEIQVRPNSRIKGSVSTMTPDDVWGVGRWAGEFAATFLDLQAEQVPTHFRQSSDWSRSLHWLAHQYSPSISRRADQVGVEQARREVLEALGLSDG